MAVQANNLSFQGQMKRYTWVAAAVMVVCVGGYFFTSSQVIFRSLMLGFFTGYIILWTNYRHVHIVGHVNSSSTLFAMFIAGLGFVIRVSLALAALILALQYPTRFNTFAVIMGLSLMYGIVMVEMVSKVLRRKG
ncbi:ATP synthase subunit I [Bacillus sp. FSL W7-1360]